MRRLPMSYLKALFTGPPDTYVLQQRHDVAGVLAALDHTLPWVRRNAAETLGNMHHQQARGPLTAALHDSDAEVRSAAQVALDQLTTPDAAAPASRPRP